MILEAFNLEQTQHWDPSLKGTMHTRGGRIQDSLLLKEQVSICLLLMPLNHSYTHFYQLLWKRVSQLPSPHILTSLLSLPLSLSLVVWLDAAVQPQRSDCLHWRACQNTVHNFNWSPWLPSLAGPFVVLMLQRLQPVINILFIYAIHEQPCVQYCSVKARHMSKEQILTIHWTLSWCFPYYSPKLRHQYLPGF